MHVAVTQVTRKEIYFVLAIAGDFDVMFHVQPFAVVKLVTGCKYNLHSLRRVLLHKKIPGSCIWSCLGSATDVNSAFVNIEVRLAPQVMSLQYSGGCQVQCRVLSTVEGYLAVQWGRGYHEIQWRVRSTVEGYHAVQRRAI